MRNAAKMALGEVEHCDWPTGIPQLPTAIGEAVGLLLCHSHARRRRQARHIRRLRRPTLSRERLCAWWQPPTRQRRSAEL